MREADVAAAFARLKQCGDAELTLAEHVTFVRQPVIRGSARLTVRPAQLRNPNSRGDLIRLSGGSIIVNASEQLGSHLYVQTKDVTVTVVGTVFLVNVEETGSRVAVIEGEVRVQQGTIHA